MYSTADIFEDDDTFGGLLDSLVNAGVNVGIGWLQNSQQPSGRNCLQGQVSGDEAMTNCVPRVMALFDELEVSIPYMQPNEVVIQANRIAGIFSDNLYFDQSIGGRSKQIREAAQAAARQRADAIIAAMQQTTSTATNTAPNVTGTGTNDDGLTFDTQTLFLAGGGLLLILLLLRS